ncbi:TlpA family protein disulfide reductase [Maribacter chungangensis]|uniref:TlpA family protein disulfide reductase n=1 Tax=Maribacter chungangensis TaxID=1069117 RepID=A0ABW3B4M3_9FLAO
MRYLIPLFIYFFMGYSYGQIKDTTQILGIKKIMGSTPTEDIYKYVNKVLPKFILSDLEGNMISSESLKGKPTVINLWFTTCAPCIEEMPLLNEIESNYEQKVNFVAVTFQDISTIKSFLRKKPFNFFHLVDSEEYLKTFGLFGYPKTLILDKNLKILQIEKMLRKTQDTSVDTGIEFKESINTLLDTLL